MITLARVLTAFILSATLFAGCGPNQQQQQKEAKAAAKQEQEAKAAPKQEDQKQKNTVIARKIFVLSASERAWNTRSMVETDAMVSANWDQASLLVAEYEGPGYQEFRKDVTKLFGASKSKAYWLRTFSENVSKGWKEISEASQKEFKKSEEELEDLTRVMKSKYLGED